MRAQVRLAGHIIKIGPLGARLSGATRAACALSVLGGLAGILGSGACSAPGSSGGTNKPTTNATNPGADSGAPTGPVSVPFLLSDQFVPSGFMGDSKTDFNAINFTSDLAQCKTPRQADAAGDCYTVAWTPVFVSGQTSAWVGIYWQYPGDNWGGKVGKTIAPGATKVTFYAAGAAGGEKVHFMAGGVNMPSDPSNGPYADTFNASTDVTLTTDWAKYEIPLTGQKYSEVLGGFAWSITTKSSAPVQFYLDDLRWEP